jgi:hypothetical protein
VGSAPVSVSISRRPGGEPSGPRKPSSGISAAEDKQRVRELQQRVDSAIAAAPARDVEGLFKRACSTDLLFLIDTTSSMSSYIGAATGQVRAIVQEIKATFLNESDVRIAIVGYKDHCNSPNIEFLDFTTSVDQVHNFLNQLRATGGGDIPEDVLGGLRQAVNASWKQQTRCIIHIADAPPHGQKLHDYSAAYDDYYTVGSEPHGLRHESLMQQVVNLKINYALLRINSSTDRMALVFGGAYGADGNTLHVSNQYRSKTMDSLILTRTRIKPATNVGPQFEEMQLGTSYDALKHLVVSTITASVSRTANRLTLSSKSKGSGRGGTSGGLRGMKCSGLGAIAESDTVAFVRPKRTISLETAPPRWDKDGWLDEKLDVEAFCLDLAVLGADTLNSMMDDDENIRLVFAKLAVKARSKPFAQGAVRLASYARPESTTSKFVLKSFIESDVVGHVEAVEDMRMQALCKAFALEFNGLAKPDPPIDFITTLCLEDRSGTRGSGNLSLEPFIEGDYVKYNSNGPWVLEDDSNPFNETAQAFSHFTFERSWGHFLVTGLQGVGNTLTDPAIQTRDPERFKLGMTNLGDEGFKFFFAMHRCNDLCRKLGLLSNSSMVMSGSYTFRETWPTMDPTVCCSNKLCRKIIRLATAKSSSRYAGHNWCVECFPQLSAFTANVPCEEPGKSHEFAASKFFYESQGQDMPRYCPEHEEKDTSAPLAAVAGSGLFASLKSNKMGSEIHGKVW